MLRDGGVTKQPMLAILHQYNAACSAVANIRRVSATLTFCGWRRRDWRQWLMATTSPIMPFVDNVAGNKTVAYRYGMINNGRRRPVILLYAGTPLVW